MKSVKMFGKSVPLVAILVASMLAIGAGAVLLTEYGFISGTTTVLQAVLVDGKDINTPIVEEFGVVTGGDTVCIPHTLENLATIPAPVNLVPSGGGDGIGVKYLVPAEYCLATTAGGLLNEPVEIAVVDDGTSITWTIDFPGEAPYDDPITEGDGSRCVGLVIALDGDGYGPIIHIHNNDGTDHGFDFGTWLYSEYDGAWHTGTGGNNILVDSLDWVSCTGGRYNSENPAGLYTITIDKSELGGLCVTDLHWALNLAIGSGFFNEYMLYEQMAYPLAVPGPSFNWGTPEVNDEVKNYEHAVLAEEITGVTLEAGELFNFMICYTFPIDIAGAYTITTTVDVGP